MARTAIRSDEQAETIRFEIASKEGLPIRGVVEIPPRASSLVVIIHGFKGFKDWAFLPWLSERFATERIASCRFDFSRCGITEGSDIFDRLDLFADDTYSIQLDDLEYVGRHLSTIRQIADLPVTLLGHSRGGAIALLGASRVSGLHSIVTWSAIATVDRWDEAMRETWRRTGRHEIVNQRTRQVMPLSTAVLDDVDANRDRLDVLAATAALQVPLLVVHGAADESVDVSDARRIAAARGDAILLVIHQASHTYGAIHPLIHVPRTLELAAQVTGRFISEI